MQNGTRTDAASKSVLMPFAMHKANFISSFINTILSPNRAKIAAGVISSRDFRSNVLAFIGQKSFSNFVTSNDNI